MIYNHQEIEKFCIDFWKKNKIIKNKNRKIKYSIILPPPNVTGDLHLGHSFDVSIQDCVNRFKILNGFDSIWIPGTDHAGIATQTKFQKYLLDNKIKHSYWSRDKFINELSKWANQHSNVIHEQWKKMGLSFSYENEVYSLDKDVKKLVNDTFIKMYNDKLIYRDYKLVNWDIYLKTAISDIEIVRIPTKTFLYHIKYFFENSQDFLVIATTRPETIFADCCVFINPNDERYKNFIGKFLINPLNKKTLEIKADKYIDMKFGTGVMKCTPAHDFNDYLLAKKYNIINFFSVLDENGITNENAIGFRNLPISQAREKIVNFLNQNDLIVKTENIISEVCYSQRSETIVEPMLSKQWFVKTKPLANEVLKKLKTDKLIFIPPRFKQDILKWLTNIEDWCISRQLSWGHQIPAYFDSKNTNDNIYVGETPPKNFKRFNDVLDTWFSSGLWPIALTFNKEKLKAFYPISLLVTGYDILFFWVARMMLMCIYITNKLPFKTLYFHGLIRDEQNRKMSKSLNNGINPLGVIQEYGADALRLFLLSNSAVGEDIRFSVEKIKYCWGIINKLFNANNLIIKFKNQNNKSNHLLDKWINYEFNNMLLNVNKYMNKFNIVVAAKYIVDFIWDKFCNNYLEMCKLDVKNNLFTKNNMLDLYKKILVILHPFAPFVSENIYQNFFKSKCSILNETYPSIQLNTLKINEINKMNIIFDVWKFSREMKIKYGEKAKKLKINLIIKDKNNMLNIIDFFKHINITINQISSKRINYEFIIHATKNCIIEYNLLDFESKEEQLIKLQNQLKKVEFELVRANKILKDKHFMKKAPKEKINLEKSKFKKYSEQYDELNDAINSLKGKQISKKNK